MKTGVFEMDHGCAKASTCLLQGGHTVVGVDVSADKISRIESVVLLAPVPIRRAVIALRNPCATIFLGTGLGRRSS